MSSKIQDFLYLAGAASVLAFSCRFFSSSAARNAVSEFSAAFVTVPNEEVAEKLSKILIENKLAACVNTIPGIQSRYWWEGKMEVDSELLLMIKTRKSLEEQVIKAVRENHPYKVSEVIFTAIHNGNPPYLNWLRESTKGEGEAI